MVAAIRSDAGASRRLMVAALEQWFTLLISLALMVEYEAVMTRSRHLVASKLSARDVGILLDAIASVGKPVRPSFLWRHADAIVTFNRRDFRPASTLFGIEVLLPGAAIERLEGIS